MTPENNRPMSKDHGHRFAVYSPTGVHIGLWRDGKIASIVQSENPGNTMEELVTLDLAQAMVAAAYENAASAVESVDGYDDIGGEHPLVTMIHARSPTDARTALEARDKRVRKDALRELEAVVRSCIYHDSVGTGFNEDAFESAILALIDRTAEGDA